MSQGELHALALALFLPRACTDASPFRFVVLDDPIQAMDPSKIDGLISVLSELAQSRQVIVFSHDDRLPEYVRQSRTPARIIEIVRGAGSKVEVRDAHDPVKALLDDAHAVLRDERLQPADLDRVIPGLCRMALEAACRERYYERALAKDVSRQDAESAWHKTRKLNDRLILALGIAPNEYGSWADRKERKKAVKFCNAGLHGGCDGVSEEDIRRVESVIKELLQQ
jgi:hypothetical protein